jgi:hypothetical protein
MKCVNVKRKRKKVSMDNDKVVEKKQWPEPTDPEPTLDQMGKWCMMDSVIDATDGCQVEPDGTCEHGHPSWLLRAGMI